ncbi:MAG TPA: hypothetical protein VFT30_01915 [Nitrospira sp.]|nr:hypothetical protein [Nitrospira sp.]
MPVRDGFSVCAKLRESGDGSRVPILIMTGLDDADSIAGHTSSGRLISS